MQAFAADVVAVLEQLDVATAVLIGHSMGGPIVLEAGIRAPDRVLGVIGVEAFFDDWSLIDAEPFRKNFAETTTAFVKSMFMPESDRDLIERVASDMAIGPSAVGIGALEGIRKWAADDFDRAFREIKAPLRMIQRERTPDLLTQVRRHAPSLVSFDVAVMP
jgi:pimeloyl-ACP methyl ester carboxylesterase